MRDATWNPQRLLNKQLQMINPMCIVITTIYFLLRGCNIETNLRINFVQLHHNLPQELVAWPVLCMEIHERAAESSNEWVYLHITQKGSISIKTSKLTHEGAHTNKHKQLLMIAYLVWIAQIKCWMIQEVPNILNITRNIRHGLKGKPFIDNLTERENILSNKR